MSNDCQWVESRLEDYLSDSAGSDVDSRIASHLKGCESCRTEVEGYGEIDKRLRAYFEHQLARAEIGAHLSLRPMRLASAIAGVAAIAIALWLGIGIVNPNGAPAPREAALSGPAFDGPVLKAADETDILRAKPAEPAVVPDAGIPTTDLDTVDGGSLEAARDFYVTDTAGYSRTLADYSGSILVLGVFESSGHDAFEEAHLAYGADARFRFVGVSLNSDIRRTNTAFPTTFPMMSNGNSLLLGTPAGAFTVVGPDGTIQRRGTFETDSLVELLGSSLEILETR